MNKQNFGIPENKNSNRRFVFKGKIYEYDGCKVIANETTCSFTKEYFKGVCVYNSGIQHHEIGSIKEYYVDTFGEKLQR